MSASSSSSSTTAVSAPTGRQPTPWDGKSTLTCTGLNNMWLKDVTFTLDAKPAIEATGACVLLLENVSITAPIALEATGGAQVTMKGGTLKGSEAALSLSGVAVVNLEGVTVDGPIDKSGAPVLNQFGVGGGAL